MARRILNGGEIVEATRSGKITRVQHMPTGTRKPGHDLPARLIDIDELLSRHSPGTFYVEMADDALLDSGIYAGDVLTVDRTLHPTYGAVVVAALDGELLVRHYCPDSEAIHLLPAHPAVAPISVRARNRCQVMGVVTTAMHRLRLVPIPDHRRQEIR
jgi:DNA polymerase V